jgi:hypothetical protein
MNAMFQSGREPAPRGLPAPPGAQLFSLKPCAVFLARAAALIFAAAPVLFVSPSAQAQGVSYTVTNLPGWNLIANQITNVNGDNIKVLITSVPVGSKLLRWDIPSGSFAQTEVYTALSGWQPGTTILNPGDGLAFSNNSAANANITFTGNPHVPVLPLAFPGGVHLLARQTNGTGSISNILGFAPPNFSIVYQFIPGPGHDPSIFAPPNYTIYFLQSGQWATPPGPPTNIPVGVSVWITTNGSGPSITSQPKTQQICSNTPVTFTASASGSQPLTYQWLLNGNVIVGATTTLYSIPAAQGTDLSNYTFKASNMFGSAFSSNAVLSFTPPPTAVGPTNSTACPNGTATFSTTPSGAGPFGYLWIKDGNPLTTQTNSVLVVSPVNAGSAGQYCVLITDACGNSIKPCATLTVGDFTPPVLTCPTNIIVECKGGTGTQVSYGVGITDNCDPKPTLTCNPPSGSFFPFGASTVFCSGVDASGNSNFCSFQVTVVDTTPPVVFCPPDRTVAATSTTGTRVFYSARVSDSCDPNPTVNCLPASGSLFPLGTTVVNCFGKDASGNSNSCSFNINVLDQSCCQAKFWTHPDVSPPAARQGHSMAYDSVRGRVVMFGGTTTGGPLGDTWEWDGNSWSLMATTGPSPRAYSSMSFDTRLNRTLLLGGNGGPTGMLGDTWAWDGANWLPIGTNSPGARYNHAMAFDIARSRTVLFGGFSAGGDLGDTWEFDGNGWTQIGAGPVVPSARESHAMAYGSAQAQMLLFGGTKGGALFGDTWKWDGTNWTMLASNGPSPRAFHAMAYNDNCDSVVLMGGGPSLPQPLSDTWEWNGSAWTLTATNIPSPRVQSAMAHDSAHGRTVLFAGGLGTQGPLNDTWLYGPNQSGPSIISTYAACGDSKILVAFSVPLDPVTAQNITSYSLSCPGAPAPILQAVLTDDPRIVCLFLSQPIGGPLAGGCCTLTVFGMRDRCGHSVGQSATSVCCTQEPCVRGNTGTEYWLTFPGNYAPDPSNAPAPQLYIAGVPGTIGTVAMSGLPVPFSSGFTIPGTGVSTVTLPSGTDLANANDIVQSNGIHVIASQKISVYGMNHIKYTTDAYLGLSTKAIGKTYIVMAYQNVFTNVPELSGVQFAIAACQDNTTVTIVPSAAVGAHPVGIPFSFTMMKGQTYQLRDTNSAPIDLTGTIVIADQPISVFSGHQCANIPSANVFFCDYIVEQLLPTELWGNNFVTVPLATRAKGDTFRCMGLYNGTTVRTNGVIAGIVNQAKFIEFQIIGQAWITSDNPIQVAQFSDSSDFDFVQNSDPFMVMIPPTPLYASSYIVQCPTLDFPANYLNVMVPAGSINQMNLDSVPLSPLIFSAIGLSGYYGAQIAVSPGAHTILCSNAPFGLVVYGWAQYDSYGYPGGSCLAPQGQPPGFTCPPTNVTVQAGTGCLGTVPDLTTQVGNGGAAVLITQSPVAGTLLPVGQYTITVTIVDQFGTRKICPSTLNVTAPSGPNLQCPQGISVNCTSPQGAVVNYQVSLCVSNATLTCVPPPGSLFPVGTTTVTCTASNIQGVAKCTFPVTVNCVLISVTRTNSGITLTWQGGGTLQAAPAVNGPWIPLSNAPSPYPVSITGTQKFFRVGP